jgi:hypothetical protein
MMHPCFVSGFYGGLFVDVLVPAIRAELLSEGWPTGSGGGGGGWHATNPFAPGWECVSLLGQ